MSNFTRTEYFKFVSLFLTIGLAAPLAAQTATGSITGRVTDASGSIIAGATVNLTSSERGVVTSTNSNDAGVYVFPNVQPGDYRVDVQKEGFKKTEVTKLTVNVGDHIEENFRLEIGSVREAVTVEGGATLVDTLSSTVSSVVTGAPIQDLPLNGRDTLQLALTQPGVMPSATGGGGAASGVPSGQFTIAGGRDNAITYLLDGGNNTSVTYGVPVVDPNPDTVGEFRIIENNYSAEYGRSNGGVVSVITKSGTNEVHGTAYDYLRNTDFNANNFFNQDTPGSFQPRPILRRNQFGVTAGGPLTLPKIINGKDRFFFFFGYQGQRQNSVLVGPQVTTFTPAELTGDFSRAVNGGPDPNVVNFLKSHPFYQGDPQLAAQGIINPARIDPVTKGYISNNLIPTSASGTLTPNGSALDNRDEFIGKTDFNITSSDRLSVTLVRFHNPFAYPFLLSGSAPNVPGFPGQDKFDNYFGTVAYTKIISPAIVNEFHFTAQRDNNSLNNPAATRPKPSDLGIAVTPDDATGPTQMLLYASNLQLGFNINGPAVYADTSYVYADSLTWIRGRHTFKAGASLTFVQNNAFFAFATNGAFAFDGPAGIGSGTDLADFLLGIPDYYYQYPGAFSAVRSHQIGTFVQDEWKVKPNLTLTLGVRYEYSSPKSDPRVRNYLIDPGHQSTKFPNTPLGIIYPGDPGAPSTGVNFPDRNDWAPRVGIAWDPFGKGKTSIRTGFGMFYDVLLAQDNQNQNGTPPFYSAAFVPFSPSLIPANGPATLLSNPFGTTGTVNPFPSRLISKNIDFATAGFLPFGPNSVFIQPTMRTPYTYQYNFSVQQQLGNGLGMEVGYVGSSSHKLIAQHDNDPFLIGTTTRILNTQPGLQIPGAFGQMPYSFGNYASANYNGLVASLTKRTGELRGFGEVFFTASYTWAHNLNDADGFIRNSNNVPYFNRHQFYTSADADIRHRFVFSGGWDLPFANLWPGGPKRLTRGWSLYPIVTAQSGFPVDISSGLFQDGVTPGPSGDGDQGLVKPNWAGGSVETFDPRQVQTITVNGTPIAGHFFFNPSGLSVPDCYSSSAPPGTPGGCPVQTYGTLQRNSFRGPGRVNFDLALEKRTNLVGERVQLNFRAEFFNVLNHTEFQSPNSTTPITSPLVGQIISTYDPRIGQLALKLVF